MKPQIGLQLYSVRNEMEENAYGTLQKVAKAGFETVEFAGLYGYTPKEMGKMLQDVGLTPISSHSNVIDNLKQEVEHMLELNVKQIVLPWNDFENKDAVLRLAEKMNEAGRYCKDNGLQLSYHNHAHEFRKEDGQYLLDVFYANTDPEYVCMQLDVCWALVGGADPVAYLQKYAGRSRTIHMKEVKTIEPYSGCAVGKGMVDFKGICNLLGPEFPYIIEQESLEGDMWSVLTEGVQYLKGLFM